MNKLTTLLVQQNNRSVPVVSGMTIRTAPKSGNQTLGIEKKKDFRERLMGEVNPATKQNFTASEANAAFERYRAETVKALGVQLSTRLASGEIQADAITADGNGTLRGIRLVKPQQTARDVVVRSTNDAAKALGIPVEKLLAKIEEIRKEEAAKGNSTAAAIEVAATPTPEAPASAEAPAEANAAGQPERLATANT